MRLRVLFLELLHKFNKLLYAFNGHSVVDRSSHTAYGTVTLKVYEACFSRFLDTYRLELGSGGSVSEKAV